MEVARLLADAKANLEGTMSINGVAGSDQPIGLQTALDGSASELAPATPEAFAAADVYTVIEQLPARYRANAVWMAELSTLNFIDQFEPTNGAKLFRFVLDRPQIEIAARHTPEATEIKAEDICVPEACHLMRRIY